ncbi:acriflavin resistance protein [Pseudoalteromonas rubra]|uniref:Acriflavin resistance protein n=1 Tax=Pseudoalteromonas rubra TaxID=43658 RepID=A0A4Q7DWU7_9GAMM|nr:efflux RND transporter permease subunit [Pseudoalteromonas rubra]RZM69548.1 acriflavin resistance protein [Pseudoalteromonas rubra]
MNSRKPQTSGLMGYFAHNSVAANLLLAFIFILGIASYFQINKQMFPHKPQKHIIVDVSFVSASAQEIEQSVLIPIESALINLPQLRKITSRSRTGWGRIVLEVNHKSDVNEVLDKVKLKVDGITTLPTEMDPLIIRRTESIETVYEMVLTGDLPLAELKVVAREIRDDLLQNDGIAIVELLSQQEEISIEVSPEILRAYGLTIQELSQRISEYSTDISAGQLKADSGIIAVRVENQRYFGDEFKRIPVKVGEYGEQVFLSDIAIISDNLTEDKKYAKYNGKNAITLIVKATEDQNIIPIATAVKRYIAQKNQALPYGLKLETFVDMTYYLNARLDMMLENLLQGAILVAVMLSVFLRFKLAMWVMIGLPACFLGTILMMPVFGVSINILSLFAFIMVLGIVVDDAIVIGESAYSEIEKSGHSIENVVKGAKKVATPATFGVLTTMAVFAPSLFLTGPDSADFYAIAVVVLLCLAFSLIESKFILPAHIAHCRFAPIRPGSWRDKFNHGFQNFIQTRYQPALLFSIRWRWSVLIGFCGLFATAIALFTSGQVKSVLNPKVPHDFPSINVEMYANTSSDQAIETLQRIEQVILAVDEETAQQYGQKMLASVLALNDSRTQLRIITPLVEDTIRPYDTFELARRWRAAMPDLPGVKSFHIQDDLNGNGTQGDFGYRLYGSDLNTLEKASRELVEQLQMQPGLYDINSSLNASGIQVLLSLRPSGQKLGLTLDDIARQVNGGLYGQEAQRVIRNGEEVRVLVRYPFADRQSLSDLEYALIRTPGGHTAMLGDVATYEIVSASSEIQRRQGFRTVFISGSIDENLVAADRVIGHIEKQILPNIKLRFPEVQSKLGGTLQLKQAQQSEQLLLFLAGIVVVYMLLAIPLRSYTQPFMIMIAIPFSLTGAIWGHYLWGLDFSVMSTFGLIAAAGVVVNDSLVMSDYINQLRKRGMVLREAVIQAGCARFRAIVLTSITTCLGVLPIMFETSLQAQLVIPMAVSLGCAILFATLITLFLIPCLYSILEDCSEQLNRVLNKVTQFNKARSTSL